MAAPITFDEFCADICGEPLTPAWTTFYGALDGEHLREQQAQLFERCAGRPYVPIRRRLGVGICGRNAQKTWSALKRGAYRGVFADRWINIRRGERPLVLYVPQDMRVGAEGTAYWKNLFQRPLLRSEVVDEKAHEIHLRNGVILRCLPCSVKSPRGWRIFHANLDETAVWETDPSGANPDVLVVQSIRPAMALYPDSEMLITSTPWRQEGLVHSYYTKRAELDDTLVWVADTLTMNPSFPVEEIERARKEFGSEYVQREFFAEFTGDIAGAFPSEDIEAAVARGRRSLPYQEGTAYFAAIDSAGGGADLFTLAIVHRAGETTVFDALHGWSVRREGLDSVLHQLKAALDVYQIKRVLGDQYSDEAYAQLFRDRNIAVLQKFDRTGWTFENKRELFANFKVSLAQGHVELLDHPESLRQLRSIETVRTSGGAVKFVARRNVHDDYVSVIVLAHHAATKAQSREPWVTVLRADGRDAREERLWTRIF